MTIKNNIISLIAFLALLTACSDEITSSLYTVGEADNAIVLQAGIGESNAGVQTRATRAGVAGGYDDIDEANHAKHLAFTSGTKAALRVDGTWLGKANGTYTKGSIIKGSISSQVVTQTTTATIKEETSSGSKHNKVEFSSAEQLYWDDYGTADPDNMPTTKGGNVNDGTDGRSKGLSIYGVAVDGETTAPTVNDWAALSWTLDADQKTNGWKNKDLLISNNVKDGGPDDTYKFDERSSGKLLEFKHAMSKITVRLIANEGFPTDGSIGGTTYKFEAAPEVKLTSNVTGGAIAEWAYTTCSVNVTDGSFSNSANPAVITMLQGTVPSGQTTTYTAIYDALVAPGSLFGDAVSTVYPIIARVKADGNIYYVSSEEIRKAISTAISAGTHTNSYSTQPGKNYILNIKINKTDIEVTATIKDWDDIEAGEATPKINVSANWGDTSATGTINSFCLYRSASDVATQAKNDEKGYSKGLDTDANNHHFPYESVVTKSGDAWSMSPTLYWPAHDTHYHFRGVTPTTSVTTGTYGKDATGTPAPHVEALSGDDATQIIKIWDAEFGADKFPSSLAIGKPIIAAGTKCSNGDHTAVDVNEYGICATEGKINLEFEYMMSQVEVLLKTSNGADAVNLTNAQVEIINGYTEGYAKLGDRTTVTTGSKGAFTLPSTTTANTYKGGIVPQKLYSTGTYAATSPNDFASTNNLRFKITITNTDGTKDVYYTDIAPINKKDVTPATLVAPEGYWKSGTHYKYELTLSKTGLTVIATLKDWITVEAVEDIWF